MADKNGKFSTKDVVGQLAKEVVERITKRHKDKNIFKDQRAKQETAAGLRDRQSTDSNNR